MCITRLTDEQLELFDEVNSLPELTLAARVARYLAEGKIGVDMVDATALACRDDNEGAWNLYYALQDIDFGYGDDEMAEAGLTSEVWKIGAEIRNKIDSVPEMLARLSHEDPSDRDNEAREIISEGLSGENVQERVEAALATDDPEVIAGLRHLIDFASRHAPTWTPGDASQEEFKKIETALAAMPLPPE